MNFAVEHLGLAARDPRQLADWYARALDAVVLRQLSPEPPAFMLKLPGGLLLELYAAEPAPAVTSQNRLAGWRHLALQVDRLEEARDLLVLRGVSFRESIKPAGGGGRVLFFSDGEGNLLHLVERDSNFTWSAEKRAEPNR